jgi:hypothetical protein
MTRGTLRFAPPIDADAYKAAVAPADAAIPEPRLGGTFIYCPVFKRTHYDPPMYCARFTTLAAYRRHYRRHHL